MLQGVLYWMNRRGSDYLKIALVVLVIAIIGGYTYFRTIELVRGGEVIITSPKNGSTIYTSLIAIKGTAKNISSITLNGRQIFTDESGVIYEEILLMPGYNMIEVRAQDRFKREIVKTLELVYKLYSPAL